MSDVSFDLLTNSMSMVIDAHTVDTDREDIREFSSARMVFRMECCPTKAQLATIKKVVSSFRRVNVIIGSEVYPFGKEYSIGPNGNYKNIVDTPLFKQWYARWAEG